MQHSERQIISAVKMFAKEVGATWWELENSHILTWYDSADNLHTTAVYSHDLYHVRIGRQLYYVAD